MKLKRFAFALCALLLAFGLPFFGCAKITDTKFRDDGVLNIIDDNNRNWYEVFVRSYYDSDEDGVGDLNGVTQKLDYIKDMGFNGIWLMPICQSNTYHGYDVADYKTVESDYGTNDDFKNLMNEAHKRGINVIVDMVFNHTSVRQSWFQKAKGSLASDSPDISKNAEYYNFSD